MAWADTIDGTNLYSEQQPHWEQDVSLLHRFITDVAIAHSGAEQRSRKRNYSRRELSYRFDGQDRSTFPARKARILQELGRPIVVPIWPLPFAVTSAAGTGPNRFTITPPAGVVTLDETEFRPDGIAYFVQSGKTSCFHQIVDWKVLSDLEFQINTTPLYPAVSYQVFGTTATIYACIRGVRNENNVDLNLHRFDETEEMISIYEL